MDMGQTLLAITVLESLRDGRDDEGGERDLIREILPIMCLCNTGTMGTQPQPQVVSGQAGATTVTAGSGDSSNLLMTLVLFSTLGRRRERVTKRDG